MKRRTDPRIHPARLARPMPDTDRQRAESRARMALAEFEAGSRSQQVLRELLTSVAVCALLAQQGIVPDAEATGRAAIDTLGSDEPDFECIRAALDALDEQRRIGTSGQVAQATKAATALIG